MARRMVSVLAWDINPGVSDALIVSNLRGEFVFEPQECEAGIDEECSDGPPPPVAPARKQFSCRTSGCVVPITCNLEAGCDAKVELFVNVKSTKTASKASRIRFAAAVASIPPGGTVSVRPKLTKRGRGILRANRSKTIKGVMAIRNSISGDFFSRTRVRIRLR